jgi:activating signal cointegrator complex subunit 3
VRHNEDILNEEMSKGARFALGAGAWDSPHVKTELLLQAHMMRTPLPVVDYATDTRSVMEQAIRIVTAMLDVASDCGWLKPVRSCISLLQALTQGCFWDDSPLLQLPHVRADDALFEELSRMMGGASSFSSLLPWKSSGVAADATIASAASSAISRAAAALPPSHAKELLRAHSSLPRMRAAARWTQGGTDEKGGEDVGGSEVDAEAPRVLVVLTNIENRASASGSGCAAHAPRFPKGREEGWWLLVCSGDVLVTSKRINSRSSMMTRLTVPVSDDEAQGLVLHVMSDCYVGLDVSLSLSGSGAARCDLLFLCCFLY